MAVNISLEHEKHYHKIIVFLLPFCKTKQLDVLVTPSDETVNLCLRKHSGDMFVQIERQ